MRKYLLFLLLLVGCQTHVAALYKTVTISKKRVFEGTISAGAPFLIFVPNNSRESLQPDRTSQAGYEEIQTYLSTQPPHADSSSESGSAVSAHIRFLGETITRRDELEGKTEVTFRILRVLELKPVTSEYLDLLKQ
jgi:hypothetical protein